MKRLLFTLLVLALPLVSGAQPVFVNEIHYDNAGTDAGEAIEVAGPAGTDLGGWSLVLYNGNGGVAYGTTTFEAGTVIPETCPAFGVVVVEYPSNGIQNGSPDGVALVDASSNVVQFLSYEGSFEAADGPAVGMASEPMPAMEDGSGPVGGSLQLTGQGTEYFQFEWVIQELHSFGECNPGQTFTSGALGFLRNDSGREHAGGITLNEVSAWPSADLNADGQQDDGDEFVEIVNTSDEPIDMNGWTIADDTDIVTFAGLDPVGSTHALVVFTRGADVSNFDPGPGNQVVSVSGLALDDAGDALGLRNLDNVLLGLLWGEPEGMAPGFGDGALPAGPYVLLSDQWVAGQSQTRTPDFGGTWDFHAPLAGTCNWSVSGDSAFDMPCPSASPGRRGGDGMALDFEYLELPDHAVLAAAYPNPFNPSTTIGFSLPRAMHVHLAVFDPTGREVARLVHGIQAAGTHEVRLDAGDLATGVYLVRLQAGPDRQTRALVLVR